MQQNQQVYGRQSTIVHAPGHEHINPGLLVLQWLTYAFWGWLAIALSVLTPITFSSFFEKSSIDVNGIIYGIAAVIMLTIIAGILDLFYYKKEVEPKTGASAAVMVIHAVIFGLFNVGWLIALVFLIINTMIGDDKTMMSTFICTALVMIVFYALLLIRTLDFNKGKFKKPAIITLLSITGLIILLAVIGPVAKSVATKNDRLIEANLGSLTTVVENYTAKNDKLPSDLEQALNGPNASSNYYQDNANKLISKKLVEYTADTKPKSRTIQNKYSSSYDLASINNQKPYDVYYYQLCVNYARENYQDHSSEKYSGEYIDSSELYVYINNHPSGKTCYRINYTDYNN